MFLLDTNVLSELRRPERADANVRAWAASQPAELFYISAITLLEIEVGILQKERRDPKQGAIMRAWFEGDIVRPFANRIVGIDAAIARRCALLHVPDPRPERDALIAASAFVRGMTIVTRDVADFAPMKVNLLNPWLGGASGA
jgi:predicted nucleic acid-binding protein